MATYKRLQTVHPPAGILVGALIAKRAVRATLIVFDTPAFQNNGLQATKTEEYQLWASLAFARDTFQHYTLRYRLH